VHAADKIGDAARHQPTQSDECALHAQLERHRGLKSFLTWAFFLAQIAAAEQLLTGGAKAQEDNSSDPAAKRSDVPPDTPPVQIAQVNTDGDEAHSITASSSSSSTIPTPLLIDSAPPQIHPHLSSLAADSAPQHVGVADGGTSGSAAQARIGSSGSLDDSPPVLLPDPIAPAPVDTDGSLPSLLGFELTIDASGLLSADVDLDLGNLDLGNLVISPLQEATHLVGSLTEELGNLLNGTGLALSELIDSGPTDLSELTGLNLTDALAGLLEQGTTGALEQSGMRSPGAIDVQLDVLFVEGQYTDYNIALRDGAVLSLDDTLAGELKIADVLASEPPPADQPPPDSAIADLLPFDEFVARPTV
jgi:hypothetical protein